MSEPTNIDRDLLWQARHVVGGFLEEMRALAQQPDVAPAEFFGQLLQRLTGLLCSAAGAVWSRPEDGRWKLEAQHELRRIPQFRAPDYAAAHARLLEASAAQEEPMLLAPGASVGGVEQARNSSDYLLVMAPLRSHKGVVGLIELFQMAAKPAALQRSYLSLVSQVCQIAQDYLKDRSLRRVDKSQLWWAELDRFRCSAHASLRLTDTAYTLANEGRRLLDCDRLSIVAAQSGKCHVAAISGQDTFDHRSSAVRRLAQLATAVVRSGSALWYAGDRSGLPPQMEQILDDYLEESSARMVGLVPLNGVDRTAGASQDNEPPAKPSPVGALVIEQFRDVPQSDESRRRVEEVQRVSALALANAIAYDGHLLAPLSRVLSQIGILRHKPWTKIALATAAALVLCLALIPANFQLEGRGTLEPVSRRDVFASTEGVIREVKVQHGSVVTRGQVLVVLTNSDVEVKLAELQGQQSAAKQQLEAAQRTLLAGQLAPAERDRLHGERAQLMETLASLKTQLELYQRKAEQLLIRAPVDGQVVTWDVDNLLKNRPVERGQMLLSMADIDGQWELEVRMPEDRLGHIAQAQAVLGETLGVTYLLATEPGVTSEGSLQEVHQRAELRGNEGNTVLLRVAIDRRQHAQLRRGATVVAKVHCGQRALAYVWFHDLWEFVQSRILFRL